MDKYKENIAVVDNLYDTIQAKKPVFEKYFSYKFMDDFFRLQEWTETIFSTSLYKTKVAAISIRNAFFQS